MKLPSLLEPTNTLEIRLPDSSTVLLPVSRPVFVPWGGAPSFSYGDNALLAFDGQAAFAELVILRLLLTSGWDGVWVETYGGLHFLRTLPRNWSLKS